MPDAWACGNGVFWNRDFFPMPGYRRANVTGACSADGTNAQGLNYRWGFSFHLLLITCVLNATAALLFYGLWLFGNGERMGTRRAVGAGSEIGAMVEIVRQARAIYGDRAVDGTWDSEHDEAQNRGRRTGLSVEVDEETQARRDMSKRSGPWHKPRRREAGDLMEDGHGIVQVP